MLVWPCGRVLTLVFLLTVSETLVAYQVYPTRLWIKNLKVKSLFLELNMQTTLSALNRLEAADIINILHLIRNATGVLLVNSRLCFSQYIVFLDKDQE